VFRMSLPGARRSTASQIRDAVQDARQEFAVTPDLDQ
jgi:hypothetical protein